MKNQYRIIWHDDMQYQAWEPPLSPEKFAAIALAQVAGTQVDLFIPTVCLGYRTLYPSSLPEVLHYGQEAGPEAKIYYGSVWEWRWGETIRALVAAGHDPLDLICREAHRLGIEVWPDIHMNDWHHRGVYGGADEVSLNSLAGPFYWNHPDYLIGKESLAAAPEGKKFENQDVANFQDYAIPAVREFRHAIAEEVCTKYDVDGFQLDFMRIPGFFKPAEIEKHTPTMTQLVRDVRKTLDRIGEKKGRRLGLSVRVPLTIEGALNIGLDARTWVKEGLVDILIPTPFFMSYLDADIKPYVDLTRGTKCRVYPLIEESYAAGYTRGSVPDWLYTGKDSVQPVTVEMGRATAMHYWRAGADGIALYNWEGMYGQDYRNHAALNEIGDLSALEFKDKRYVVTRKPASLGFPLHWPPAPLPIDLQEKPAEFVLRVSDDLESNKVRLDSVTLWLHIKNLTASDEVEVSVNGKVQGTPLNPLVSGDFVPRAEASWLKFDMMGRLPKLGENEIKVKLVKRNPAFLAKPTEFRVVLSDAELDVRYSWPQGEWRAPRTWTPRS